MLAEKNEEIQTGTVKSCSRIRAEPNQKGVRLRIAWSKTEHPKTASEAQELGSVVIKFPNTDESDMESILEFHFAETVIKAVAYRVKDPDNKQIGYITNWM